MTKKKGQSGSSRAKPGCGPRRDKKTRAIIWNLSATCPAGRQLTREVVRDVKKDLGLL